MDGHRVRFQPAAAESPWPHTARQQVSLQLRYMSSHFQAALAGHLTGSNTATSTRDAMQAYLEGDTTGKDRSSHAMPLPMPGGAWPGNGDNGQATLGCDVPAGRPEFWGWTATNVAFLRVRCTDPKLVLKVSRLVLLLRETSPVKDGDLRCDFADSPAPPPFPLRRF